MILKPPKFSSVVKGQPLADAIKGCWLLNDKSGIDLLDASGYHNDLILDTPLVRTAGKFGNSLLFTGGVAEFAYMNDNPSLTVGSRGFAVSCWIYLDSLSADAGIIGKSGTTETKEWALFYRSDFGRFAFRVYDIDNDGYLNRHFVVSGCPLVGAWHHIVATFNGGTSATDLAIYVDGIRRDTNSLGSGFVYINDLDSSLTLGYVGAAWAKSSFVGRMDNAKYFARGLSSSEIAQLYQNPFCMFEQDEIGLLAAALPIPTNDFSNDPNCVALYRFESGELTTDSKGTNTLTNVGVSEESTIIKEGSCSAFFVAAQNDKMYCADADLSNDFPGKYGTANKSFSFCFWFKTGSGQQIFIDKGSYLLGLLADKFILYLKTGELTSYTVTHTGTIVISQWYHVGVTYDGSTDEVRIRIWDDTEQEILASDKVETAEEYALYENDFSLGWSIDVGYELSGFLDELVVFDDVLTVEEIDEIRNGIYEAGGLSIPVARHHYQMAGGL